MWDREIVDLETAEGILLAFDCSATAGNVRKVINRLKAMSVDAAAMRDHWHDQTHG